MSGDWLPHSGAFLGWNFGIWNHHGSHSSLKMHSKWDCHSSTQRFASGSLHNLVTRKSKVYQRCQRKFTKTQEH
ncbi:MAG: hypothetical protein R8M38_05970 [Mariprofundaceae bacterium]